MRADAPQGTQDPVQVDGYRVLRRLAEGGQGVVYLAESPAGEQVALKLLHPAWLAEPTARERLVKEIAAARTVARFCVAQVLDARTDGDTPYVVSEYVEGPSLTQHVRERGVLAGAALDRLAVATATALAAIHRARIVHRDLKPSNVMLGPDGPRVIDFGIARNLSLDATSVGRIVGSPNYMSPEQLSGDVVGPKADVFSWACTVVFAATGRAPFTADDLVGLMYKVVHETADTSGILDPDLRYVVDRCLAKSPDDRPSSQELLLELLGGTDDADLADVVPPVVADGARPAGAPVPGVPDDPTLPTSLLARATALPEGIAAPAPIPAPIPAPTPVAAVPHSAVPGWAPPVAAPPPWPQPPPPLPLSAPAPAAARPAARRWVVVAAVAAAVVLAAGSGFAVRALLSPDTPQTRDAGAAPVAQAPAPAGTSGAAAPRPSTAAPAPAASAASSPAAGSPSPSRSRTPSRTPAGSTKPATTGVPVAFAGTWRGTATQLTGSVQSYDVTVRLPLGAQRGTISSKALGCSGRVRVVGTPTARVITLEAVATDTADGLCAGSGGITMTKKAPNRASWVWVDDSDPGNVASAVLAR